MGVSGDALGYNLYLYVSNNPINNSDDTGHFLKKVWNSIKKKASQVAKKVTKDENTIKDITVGFNREITSNSKVASEASVASHFVGIDFGLFVFVGFRIRIGFNM